MGFPLRKVAALRKQLGLNYEEFSRLLGVTSRSVRRWELDCKPEKIPGSAGDILIALEYGLQKNQKALLDLIAETVGIGGLAFVLIKLLDVFFANSPRRHT